MACDCRAGCDCAPDARARRLRADLTEAVKALSPDDLQPVRDRLVVLPLRENYERKTDSGLFVVGNEGREPRYSIVLAVPSNCPEDLEVGDVVISGAWTGQPLEIGGMDVRVIAIADVLAVVP